MLCVVNSSAINHNLIETSQVLFKISNCSGVEIKFANSMRKHKMGRARILFVMLTTTPSIRANGHKQKWTWIGDDERGLNLEVVAVKENSKLTVIHAMPTGFRRNKRK